MSLTGQRKSLQPKRWSRYFAVSAMSLTDVPATTPKIFTKGFVKMDNSSYSRIDDFAWALQEAGYIDASDGLIQNKSFCIGARS